MDRNDKGFKLSILNQLLVMAIIMLLLGTCYVMLNDMVNVNNKVFYYDVVGCNVNTTKDNVTVSFIFEGNYTILIEYDNMSSGEAVDKYFIQYTLFQPTTNTTYEFDITRDYDRIFLIVRNDDLDFSEGHRID